MNYTPLDVPHLEKKINYHETNTVHVALLLVGTFSAGVLAVMLLVLLQGKMSTDHSNKAAPKSQMEKEVPVEQPTPIPTVVPEQVQDSATKEGEMMLQEPPIEPPQGLPMEGEQIPLE